jgi:FkbM family methyltransferase
MKLFKKLIRYLLVFFHLDLTKNLKYDRLTNLIMKKVIHRNSNCIDIGCHKGEILDIILKFSPEGQHFAFEPIPPMYEQLAQKITRSNVKIFPYALAEHTGNTTFNFVKNAPAYSGIKKRHYDIDNPEIDEINVELRTLDEMIPGHIKIDFVKIDVEGAEFGVLKGGINTFKRNKPVIVFECGLGASDFYGTQPQDIYRFITHEIGMKISMLQSYIDNKGPLTEEQFLHCYNQATEYYFIACP